MSRAEHLLGDFFGIGLGKTAKFKNALFVNPEGRFIGTNIGVNANPDYNNYWWGEGEVKVYLDGDQEYPTLVGTGTEDYIGTAWGQGEYFNDYTRQKVQLIWKIPDYLLAGPTFIDLMMCPQQHIFT